MTIRLTQRKFQPEAATAGRAEAESQAAEVPMKQGVDAARVAAEVAHGVRTIETKRGMVSARASEMAYRVSLAQSVDSAAIEVKALLGRMRLIAEQGATGALTTDQQDLLQQEFEMLQSEMERLMVEGRTVSGEIDTVEKGHLLDDMSPKSLKVDRAHARVDTQVEADWAMFRIDTAEDAIDSIRDEFGTIEERVDAAIAELTEFVDSHAAPGRRIHTTSEAMDAAQRARLHLMQQEAMSPSGLGQNLQQSVTALLQ